MSKQSKLETVASLRSDTEAKMSDFNANVKKQADISKLARSEIINDLKKTTEHSHELRKQFEEFSQSALYSNEHLETQELPEEEAIVVAFQTFKAQG